jgi:hypothetical protein
MKEGKESTATNEDYYETEMHDVFEELAAFFFRV